MVKSEVTVQEIEIAERLSAQREFTASLARYREMLPRAKRADLRMRILFGVVTCSTWLGLEALRENAIEELKGYPDYEVSHAFVVMTQASALVDFGRAQEALELIDTNLRSAIFQKEDFQDWKYEYLFLKGRSLTRLARCVEALQTFDEAHNLYADGRFEADMLLDRANCLLYVARYDAAYNAARQVLTRGDNEMATLAMQYMAESRLWQGKPSDALELYAAIQKRLPCRLVQESRIQAGIRNAMAYLEKNHPRGKPS
jgi:tetratricopeptide (TPR) repeat protein